MKKQEMMRRSREAYTAKYPERYAAWHRLMEAPQACEVCGGPARPWFEPHPSAVLRGWRCYGCRAKENAPVG